MMHEHLTVIHPKSCADELSIDQSEKTCGETRPSSEYHNSHIDMNTADGH